MICLSDMTSDCNCLIAQIIESINKMKNSFIVSKMIAVRQLFSDDVLVITDMITIKKKLKYDSI